MCRERDIVKCVVCSVKYLCPTYGIPLSKRDFAATRELILLNIYSILSHPHHSLQSFNTYSPFSFFLMPDYFDDQAYDQLEMTCIR
jgi:hypothetical protein